MKPGITSFFLEKTNTQNYFCNLPPFMKKKGKGSGVSPEPIITFMEL